MGLNHGRFGGLVGCVCLLVAEDGAQGLFKGMGKKLQCVAFIEFEAYLCGSTVWLQASGWCESRQNRQSVFRCMKG
eukprot:COSAG05_NODE_125_length_17331_cov_16.188058_17_plen_76_part_00